MLSLLINPDLSVGMLDFIAGVEFREEPGESAWILPGTVCESL